MFYWPESGAAVVDEDEYRVCGNCLRKRSVSQFTSDSDRCDACISPCSVVPLAVRPVGVALSGLRRCAACFVYLSVSEFDADLSNRIDGLARYCRGCGDKRMARKMAPRVEMAVKKYGRLKKPKSQSGPSNELKKDRYLLSRYGITLKEYENLLEIQGGVCAICLRPESLKVAAFSRRKKSLCVDHDHKTLRVRGLLCNSCNAAIGKLGDDIESMKRACAYLLEPPGAFIPARKWLRRARSSRKGLLFQGKGDG